MKILITGGLGYLGGRLAKYLVNNTSHTVRIGTRKNITGVEWLSQVEVVNTLWSSNIELEKICCDVDLVIHASGMNAVDCSKDPSLALKVNGDATARLLKSSIKQGVKRIIYISTAHVYDSPLAGKVTEQSSTKNLHPYATSHKAGENHVRLAHSKGEIEGIVVRLSNSFGPPSSLNANCWHLATNDFCKQGIESKNIIVKTSEIETRDFISITNVCRAIEHLIKLPLNRLSDGLFNIGGEWSPTILEIANILSKRIYLLTDKKINIKSQKLEQNSKLLALDFDIKKIKLTGFELINDRNNEFDDLIRFCHKNFGV